MYPLIILDVRTSITSGNDRIPLQGYVRYRKKSVASYKWKRIDWMQERSGGSLAIF